MSDPGLPDLPPPEERPPGGDPGSVPDDPTGTPKPSPETPRSPGSGAASPVTEPPGGELDRAINDQPDEQR
jgi:hypothetical protein